MSERITPFGLQPEQNILKERLLTLCPEIFQDGKLNIEALQSLLPDEVEGDDDQDGDSGKEHFGLSWPGKNRARQLALKKPVGSTLKPCPGEGVNEDMTQNIFIEGDNLEVLKLLREAYSDQVKMIYIDPPYNTGNDFVYKDDFEDSIEEYLKKTGQKAGKTLLVANPKASGRFHTNWLNFIYPRLRLAKELLSKNGVILISIDDNEGANLKLLMDEIFGEENFVSNMIWQSRTSISNDQEVSLNHNHTYIYAKNRDELIFNGENLKISDYSNPDNDPRGPWKLVPIDANKEGGDTKYGITNPATGVVYYPPTTRSWSINSNDFKKLSEDGRIMFGLKGDSAPKRKMFLNERLERGDTKTPSSLVLDAGTTKDGTNEVIELFHGKKYFSYPKPVSLLKKFIQYGSNKNSKDIVLDFFAGSSTTAHAVIDLDKEDGGNRRFICVQLPELYLAGSEAYNMGYETIADVSKERIRQVFEVTREEGQRLGVELSSLTVQFDQVQADYDEVVKEHSDNKLFKDQKLSKSAQKLADKLEKIAEKIQKKEQTIRNIEKLDLGFKVYELKSSGFAAYKPYTGSNTAQLTLSFQQQTDKPLVDGWTKPDLITELMLLEGFPLHSRQEPQSQYSENEVVAITSDFNENTLYVCLDTQLQMETVEGLSIGSDDIFVCLDSALTDVQKVQLDDKLKLKTV